MQATADLRDDTGRLHIDRIAAVFGLTRAALARAVGSTPQAVAKTPNAESLQSRLGAFEEELEEMRQHHVDLDDPDVPGAGTSCGLTELSGREH